MTPRLRPDRPLPPYTYVPGQAPHPFSDPRGHSYGRREPPPAAFDPAAWQDDDAFCFGLDLLNHGYYWEAHEQWEGLWHACGRAGVTADFLKGLIHLAAAGVKHLEGRPAGVKSHAGRAAELWRRVGAENYLGLRVADLVAVAETIHTEGWPVKPIWLLPVSQASG
jgi:hypothetical protein